MKGSQLSVTERQVQISAAAVADQSLAAAARNLGLSTTRVRVVAGQVQRKLRQISAIETEAGRPVLERRLAFVSLPARVTNSLISAGFETIGSAAKASQHDLLKIDNFGSRSLRAFQRYLHDETGKGARDEK